MKGMNITMMKNNKGITLLTLTITIIVVIILASIGSDVGINMIKKATYYKAVNELKAMQAKVNEWKDDNIEYGEQIPSAISSKANEAYLHAKNNNQWGSDIGSFSDFKYFSKDYIKNELDIEGIDLDFIVNFETRIIILVNGVEMEGTKYFSLCEIEDEMYNV